MLRRKIPTSLNFIRERAAWMNKLQKNIDKNHEHQRKMYLLRKKTYGQGSFFNLTCVLCIKSQSFKKYPFKVCRHCQ